MFSLQKPSIKNFPIKFQIELEKLNSATDQINRYEIELDDLKKQYQDSLEESKDKVKNASHKITSAIEIAHPYYQARLYCSQLAKEVQLALINYDRAKTHLSAAKEMVYLAELGLGEKAVLDTAYQEMLSHATTRVNQCTNECTEVKNNLKILELKLEVSNNRVLKLQNQLKSAIKVSRFFICHNFMIFPFVISSVVSFSFLIFNFIRIFQIDFQILTSERFSFRPYYETRANYNGLLKAHKKKIAELEEKVVGVKATYNEALRNLEEISESIHKSREEQLIKEKERAGKHFLIIKFQ